MFLWPGFFWHVSQYVCRFVMSVRMKCPNSEWVDEFGIKILTKVHWSGRILSQPDNMDCRFSWIHFYNSTTCKYRVNQTFLFHQKCSQHFLRKAFCLRCCDRQIGMYKQSTLPTNVFMKNTIFWDVKQCSPLETYQHFGRTYCFLLQGKRVSQRSKGQAG
jgi:hypothetical protein